MTGVLWIAWAGAVVLASRLRNRAFAVFVAVLLAIVVACSSAMLGWTTGWARGLVATGVALAFAYVLLLSRPRMRGPAFNALISIPAQGFTAACVLVAPWALASAFGVPPYGWWVALILGGVGVYQTLRSPRETLQIGLDGAHAGPLAPAARGALQGPPLRIIQITDPHLGPFMSVARLRRICERAVAADPDLVLVTGDLLTMASHGHPELVAEALAPLAALPGRVFACYGNHDHEARRTVDHALEQIGARLLVDEAELVETRLGPVEIVGADFVYRGRGEHLALLFARIGVDPEHPRILLLHDPGAFRHLPDGAADLTLSGHTHGGQVGLLSLGIPWTFVRGFSKMPDHGFWAHGRNRLYVHRGTGVYGFPVRLGVPGEESVLEVSFAAWT